MLGGEVARVPRGSHGGAAGPRRSQSPGGTSGAPHRALGHGDSTLTPHTQDASTQVAVTAPRTRGELVSKRGERSSA